MTLAGVDIGAYTALRKYFQFTTDQTGVVVITFESIGMSPADAILSGMEVRVPFSHVFDLL